LSRIPDNLTGGTGGVMRKESKFKCSIDGCEKHVHGHSYCKTHYQKWYRTGDPISKDQRLRTKWCSVEGCGKNIDGNGYCNKHNRRFKKYGDPHKLIFEQHRMTNTLEYGIWEGIKRRCYSKKHVSYKWYGGLGVKMCDRWLHSFVAFYEDMGKRPDKGYDIDRIDPYGDYEPNNCQWITHKENCNKKRKHTDIKCVEMLCQFEKEITIPRVNMSYYQVYQSEKLVNLGIVEKHKENRLVNYTLKEGKYDHSSIKTIFSV